MMSVLISLAVSTLVVVSMMKFFPDMFGNRGKRTKDILGRINSESEELEDLKKSALKKEGIVDNEQMDAMLRKVSFIDNTHQMVQACGLKMGTENYLLLLIGVLLLFTVGLNMMGMSSGLSLMLAAILTLLGSKQYLKYRKEKRSLDFVNNFPEAVDMIVRSVRSGHPVQAALGMIADNMEDPIGGEFKRVVDEIAYGRPMVEALAKMADRIGEQDVRFFVVVLGVQQETGGNLGEVLSNLSNILRRRKQMRLKIRALTSEGRMTAYILGSLPFFVIGALQLVSPNYLVPLFTDLAGRFIFGLAMAMILAAFVIVRKMVQIDI